MATVGMPLAICQTTLGLHSTVAMAAPPHGHHVASTARRDVTTSPRARATGSRRTRSSCSRPMPATTPAANQHRGRCRSTASRTSHTVKVQVQRS